MGRNAILSERLSLYKTATICYLTAVVFFCVFLYSFVVHPGTAVDFDTKMLKDNLYGQISSGRWYFVGISFLAAAMGLISTRKGNDRHE